MILRLLASGPAATFSGRPTPFPFPCSSPISCRNRRLPPASRPAVRAGPHRPVRHRRLPRTVLSGAHRPGTRYSFASPTCRCLGSARLASGPPFRGRWIGVRRTLSRSMRRSMSCIARRASKPRLQRTTQRAHASPGTMTRSSTSTEDSPRILRGGCSSTEGAAPMRRTSAPAEPYIFLRGSLSAPSSRRTDARYRGVLMLRAYG